METTQRTKDQNEQEVINREEKIEISEDSSNIQNNMNDDNLSQCSREDQEKAKLDICSSPFIKHKEEPTNEEIRSRIDELNEKYQEDSRLEEEAGAINVDEILMNNIKNRRNREDGNSSSNSSSKMNLHQEPHQGESQVETTNISNNNLNVQSSKLNNDSENDNLNGQVEKITVSLDVNLGVDNDNTNMGNQINQLSQTVRNKEHREHREHKISEFEVINQDHYLAPFEGKIRERVELFKSKLKEIEKNEGSLLTFSESYNIMGLNVTEDGITYKEYAPGAKALTIVRKEIIINKKILI